MIHRASLLGCLSGVLIAGAFLAGGTAAVEPSGTVVGVDPSVDATGPGGQRLLQLEGAVFMGDQIVASPHGLAQIKFIDDTRIVIGPNSRLTIDQFVFNPDKSVRKLTVTALHGAFRFISGKSSHDAYSLRTPTMVIGVRGTIVDIAVDGEDSAFSVPEGSATGCTPGGCVTVEEPCRIYYAAPSAQPAESTGIDKQRRLAYQFDLVDSALAPDFRRPPQDCGRPDSRIFDGYREGGSKTTKSPTPPRPPRGDDYGDDDNDDSGGDA